MLSQSGAALFSVNVAAANLRWWTLRATVTRQQAAFGSPYWTRDAVAHEGLLNLGMQLRQPRSDLFPEKVLQTNLFLADFSI